MTEKKSDLEVCREFRRKLDLFAGNDIKNLQCETHTNDGMTCWADCPVPSRKGKSGEPKGKSETMPLPKEFTEVNKDVFVEVKPKKEKKISVEIEQFLLMQTRVIEKLNWHPELWKVLDRLSSSEILDKLVGKGIKEIIPAHLGGKMEPKVSKETKKMFADMEKKLEAEGQKAYDLTGDEDGGWAQEARQEEHGWFDRGIWVEPKKMKKDEKCMQCGKEYTPSARPWGDVICDECYKEKKEKWQKRQLGRKLSASVRLRS